MKFKYSNYICSMKTIIVSEICSACMTNTDAVVFDSTVRQSLISDQIVKIDFHGISGITTSFLNSSFGSWIEDFGFEKLMGKVLLTNYTPFIAKSIKQYLEESKNLQK